MKTPPDGWDEHERDIPEELARELGRGGTTHRPAAARSVASSG